MVLWHTKKMMNIYYYMLMHKNPQPKQTSKRISWWITGYSAPFKPMLTLLCSPLRGVTESPVCQQGWDQRVKPTSIFSVTFTSLSDMASGRSISCGVSRPTTLSPGFMWELEPYEFISSIAAASLRNSIRHYASQTTDLCSKEAALWCHTTKWNFQR